MKKLLVILGPTSTGKTDLALQLASKFQGELVSADSRQVYVGLDLGTGKLPGKNVVVEKGKGFWVMDGVKIRMIDVVSPHKHYTVYNFVKDAQKVIKQIIKNKKISIIVGGSGLYLRALADGLPNLGIPVDLNLRKKLERLSLEELQKKLQKVFIKKWNLMNNSDRQNPRRLIRAVELVLNRGNQGDWGDQSLEKEFNILKIGLTGSRKMLYEKTDRRVIKRINQGMIKEAKSLYKNGLSLKRMKQLGLEYGVLADYLEGKIREIQGNQGLIKIMQNKIHRYVRRQLTWFKKEKDVFWFDITEKNYISEVENLVTKWYYPYDAE